MEGGRARGQEVVCEEDVTCQTCKEMFGEERVPRQLDCCKTPICETCMKRFFEETGTTVCSYCSLAGSHRRRLTQKLKDKSLQNVDTVLLAKAVAFRKRKPDETGPRPGLHQSGEEGELKREHEAKRRKAAEIADKDAQEKALALLSEEGKDLQSLEEEQEAALSQISEKRELEQSDREMAEKLDREERERDAKPSAVAGAAGATAAAGGDARKREEGGVQAHQRGAQRGALPRAWRGQEEGKKTAPCSSRKGYKPPEPCEVIEIE